MSNIIVVNPFMNSPGTLWTPADMTTYLWLDANDSATITQSGGTVSQWNDKSGNGRNFTQGTGSLQPTYTESGLNNKTVLDFAGDYLTSSSAASVWNLLHNTTGSSVFVVAKAATSSNPDALLGIIGNNAVASSNTGFSLVYDDRASTPANNRYSGLVATGTIGAQAVINAQDDVWTPNAYQVVGAITDPNNGTAANRQSTRFNGGSSIAVNIRTTAPVATDASFALQIGATGNNAFPFTGGIAEVIIVSGLISDRECARIEGYLAHKWGLTANLPSNHLFKTTPPYKVP